ncbi:hypothetical protein [Legionella cardiaca]|uniref:Uncharacterized protein n=1 Tax=Legionella cardiaca TaxID=1071983 RepID=A0ABY8ASD4_9GAMM|nr:hypothetical protein [Legionella cardiaca]WED42684.1 hypothetical protein PXX05_12370 [Legionella cardiaca]
MFTKVEKTRKDEKNPGSKLTSMSGIIGQALLFDNGFFPIGEQPKIQESDKDKKIPPSTLTPNG